MKNIQLKRMLSWISVPLWVIVSFLLASFLCSMVVGSVKLSTTESLLFQACVYGVTLVVLLGGPYVAKGYRVSLKTMGINKLASWLDIPLAVVGFVIYFLCAMILLTVVQKMLPSFDAMQIQDLGISGQLFGVERTQAFFLMVVIGPLVEEVVFRGYLYGELRKRRMAPWLATIIVSILFGLAHGQWNVGIDVFVLSVVMCILRELTGSIWAGLLVHIIKNLIAFVGVFVLMA